ncbi:CvpA family protein [Patescibacteria group bacterium]|nr:CvpA family protein [Patescibacteria group bacterium]MBU1915785.1 CvpA family protein [Patescibacteria group bacterium]
MNYIDLTLLIILGGFVLAGLWFGVIHMIGSLVGVLFGAFCAGHFYTQAADFITPLVGGNENLAKLLAFFGIFILVNRLIGLIFHVIEKIFRLIAVIPFLKTFNRLLGAILGLIEGTLVLGLAVYFSARFPFSAAFSATLLESSLAKALNLVGAILAPLLPDAIRALQSIL